MTADLPASTAAGERPEDPGPVALADEQDLEVDTDRLGHAAARMLRALGLPGEAQLSIALVDVGRIAELKERAFGHRAPTDVLSFPLDDPADPMPGPVLLGDVVICPAVALRQARALGRSLHAELVALLAHGVLHLLGRDHGDPRAEHAMAAEERALLAAIGEEAA